MGGGMNDAAVTTTAITKVGFIGLGDQGLPMAIAIAQAGFELHVWARRPASMEPLDETKHTSHDTVGELAAVCDVVAVCVREDDDVQALINGELLANMRRGSVLVNHGTGTPQNAVRFADQCAAAGIDALDAPVSGGRPGAEGHRLTTLVGGDEQVAKLCRPVFESFSTNIVHLGPAGAGQMAKLFNNAMLIMNQTTVAELLHLAHAAHVEVTRLKQSLALGSGSSSALTLFGTMITADDVDHLRQVEDVDVDIFDTAMREAGVDASAVVERAHAGAEAMPGVIGLLDGAQDPQS